jgi:glycine cleavage system H lipoate-binding protein
MSILFVLLMFLLILTVSYFRTRNEVPAHPDIWAGPQVPRMQREYGFSIPRGYVFHPGHTWALKEGAETARIGLDSFAANLIGNIDRVDVVGENRWVRQGQKFATIHSGNLSVDLISPVEGVVTRTNHDLAQQPALTTTDPYKDGWIAILKAPDLPLNLNNLLQGTMVAPWMQNSVSRLNAMANQSTPALAQDGGLPPGGLLTRLAPELRHNVIKEFFLN